MWITSPLGKWEQETRMDKALRDAERMRAQEEGHDAGSRAGFGSVLRAAGDPYAVVRVRQCRRAAHVGADVIAAYGVAHGAGA